MITAKDFVPVGASFHAMGGEMLAPSHVYFAGKIPLLVKAVLVAVNVLVLMTAGTMASMVAFLHENKKLIINKGMNLNEVMILIDF